MRQPRRFLFDECVSLPSFQAVRDHLAAKPDPPQLGHILETEFRGLKDEEWIPKIAEEQWIVISEDKGRGGLKRGLKLHMVCVTYKVTHILVSAAIQHLKAADKTQVFIKAWPRIERATKEQPGTRLSLRFNNKGEVILRKMTIKGE